MANNPSEIIWLHIKQLTSEQVSKNLIKEKYHLNGKSINEELLEMKALGLSSSIKNALGFWGERPTALNSWILSRYYAILQFTLAEQVSSCNNNSNLSEIQKHTEQGHGLAIWHKDIDNPLDYIIYPLKSGHFNSYTKFLGFNTQSEYSEKRIKRHDELSNLRFSVSIKDLFTNIAELEQVLVSFIQTPSNCLHIGHSSKNYEYIQTLKEEKKKNTRDYSNSNFIIDVIPEFTYVNVIGYNYNPIDLDIIVNSKIPLKEIQLNSEESKQYPDHTIFTGKLYHTQKIWWNAINTYKSEYTGTMYITPLFDEIYDPIIRHFLLLYGLSIIVRYMPDVWQDITSGKQNHIGALLGNTP